jgi:hypothetical protein
MYRQVYCRVVNLWKKIDVDDVRCNIVDNTINENTWLHLTENVISKNSIYFVKLGQHDALVLERY